MSFLKRIFGKREEETDVVGISENASAEAPSAEQQQTSKEKPEETGEENHDEAEKPGPPPPRVTPPPPTGAADTPVRKARNESQTFQVQRPMPQPDNKPEKTPAAASSERRRIQIRKSEDATPENDEDVRISANQDLRRSQTMRVRPPAAKHETPPAEPSIRDELRQSQTIRVRPPVTEEETAATPDDQQQVAEPDTEPQQHVELPLHTVLSALPDNARGPQWSPDAVPEGSVPVDRDKLKEQLTNSHVNIPIDNVRAALPAGWIDDSVEGEIAVDTKKVLTAVHANDTGAEGQPEDAAVENAEEPEIDTDLGTIIAAVPQAAGRGQQTQQDPEDKEELEEDEDEREDEEPQKKETNLAQVPVIALLAVLPEPMRGSAWRKGVDPGGTFAMQRRSLLTQLQSGKVTVSIGAVSEQLPAGWVTADATGEVSLDLAKVVPDLPAEWLQITADEDEDVVAASEMRNLFKPADAAAEQEQNERGESEEDDLVEVPADVMLSSVPTEFRGPAWHEDRLTGSSLLVPREALMTQLSAGSITVDAEDLREQLPEGWLTDDASGDVALDLASVVSALPADLFQAKGDMAREVAESEKIGELFGTQVTEQKTQPASAQSAEPKAESAESQADEPADAAASSADLPLSSIALSLPDEARGHAWNHDDLPDGTFVVDTDDLLRQLAAGRVAFAADDLQNILPEGWICEDAQGAVELDLATVVQALPADLMQVNTDVAEDVEAASAIGVLFQSAEPVKPAPDEEIAAPAAEDVPPETQEAEPLQENLQAVEEEEQPAHDEEKKAAAAPEQALEDELDEDEKDIDEEDDEDEDGDLTGSEEWDGVEPSLEMAPLGININTAGAEQLMSLPSVGEVRANDIIAYRQKNGPFSSIFQLADVPGVGPASFRKMTGFSVRRRSSRHDVLFNMMKLNDDGRPVLARIADALREECRAAGCLLTNQEGIPLSVSGDMPDATTYAALGSRYFFRTRRHLQKFVDKASDCIILPGSKPQLMLLARNDVVAIFTLADSGVSATRLRRLRRAMREIGWMLSHRAVVMNI